jgi:hypothetical protein
MVRRIGVALATSMMLLGPMPQSLAAQTTYFPPPYPKQIAPCSPSPKSGGAPVVSEFENRWYSKHLLAAKEPSLYEAARRPGGNDVIRFTWLPSFHPPVIVRVEGLRSASPHLIAKQLSGAGGYDPGVVAKQIDRRLSPVEAVALRHVLLRTNVFDLPALECRGGMDGAKWIVEGLGKDGYHFVARWSPDDGKVHETGLALLKLTGWTFKNIY